MSLTLDELRANTRFLRPYVETLITKLRNRAQFQAQWLGVTIGDPGPRYNGEYVASMNITLEERIITRVDMHLHYLIRPDGWVITYEAVANPLANPGRNLSNTYMSAVEEWVASTQLYYSQKRQQQRALAVKEQLAAYVWHPARVLKRIEEGGHEALDAFAGGGASEPAILPYPLPPSPAPLQPRSEFYCPKTPSTKHAFSPDRIFMGNTNRGPQYGQQCICCGWQREVR